MIYTQQQISQLAKVQGVSPLYRLRWRFDFAGRPSRVGGWNSASTNPKDMAAFVDKTGLVRACIEAESVLTYQLKVLAEVDGHCYVTSSWEMAAALPTFNSGAYTTQGSIIGLSLVTLEEKLTVFVSGQVLRKPLLDYQKKIDLTEHRLGV